ncbi:helix-turn-helix domain-containing protein [Aquimarina algicola]|uniref:Helix-turn-helix domain-containing protein n=1 Tax=Aquimarina algicola TaxID=2589995 RepID=A0A504JED0_9FLAO|nr:helix-turn-helix domain-containing protein [Aquimarina algicola]TPN84741.1 helix-turn-helix domain-containing protein [Aquimarina algicola]
MPIEIENIVFSRFVKQTVPFEFISIKELYARCEKSAYDLSKPHRIKFHSLLIITKGQGEHTIDFIPQKLYPGVIIPLTKEQVHHFEKPLQVEGFVISFEEHFITSKISEQNLFHFFQLFHNPVILIGEENIKKLIPFFDLLQNIHIDTNVNLKSELINTTFMGLLFQIKRHSIYQHDIFESQRFKDFLAFKQLLLKKYNQSHNAKDYAKELSFSYKYLNDICKEICNQTAKSFIDNWLLLEIKRNISEKKYTSQEIAFKMGFNEPSNFIRFFKKFTGVTPKHFQKEM